MEREKNVLDAPVAAQGDVFTSVGGECEIGCFRTGLKLRQLLHLVDRVRRVDLRSLHRMFAALAQAPHLRRRAAQQARPLIVR